MFVKTSWDVEEMMDQRISSDGYKSVPDYDSRNGSKITARFKEFGTRNKSRSENDVSRGFSRKKWCKDVNDEDSTSPGDSNVTIIRVLRRSQAEKIILTNRNTEDICTSGIFGDRAHTPNSLSMVNLATMKRHYDATSITSKNDCLVPLSSWGGNEIPVYTVSDSTIYTSRSMEKNARTSLLSFATWKRYCLANKTRKSVGIRPEINNEGIPENVPMQHGLPNVAGNSSKESLEIEYLGHDSEISCKSQENRDVIKKKNKSSRFSLRMENAFRRFVRCSWIPGNAKNKK